MASPLVALMASATLAQMGSPLVAPTAFLHSPRTELQPRAPTELLRPALMASPRAALTASRLRAPTRPRSPARTASRPAAPTELRSAEPTARLIEQIQSWL